jgi:hypothetical protein
MNIDAKHDKAIELLIATGIWRKEYKIPLVRLLWRLGIDISLPWFSGYWRNSIISGFNMAVLWGLIMWVVDWSREGIHVVPAIVCSIFVGIIVGPIKANAYARLKSKHNLPSWDELGGLP